MLLPLLFAFSASALPPVPGCETWLVRAEARAVFDDVTTRHPNFDRAYVGQLWPGWRSGPALGEWGIYDRHNDHKIFSSRYEYIHQLKDGDRLILLDERWEPSREGTLELRSGFITYPGGTMGPESSQLVPRFIEDADRYDETLARAWVRGPNAIALTTMSPAEKLRWQSEQSGDFERWLAYRDRPSAIVSQGTTFYRLGFFETSLEGKPSFRVDEDGIALSLDDGRNVQPIERGDYIWFFDAEGVYLERTKYLDFDRLRNLQETVDPAEIVDVLNRTARMVIVRNHFFLN